MPDVINWRRRARHVPLEPKGVALKWLGVAGWEIRTGKTIILIDPFLTRKDRVPDTEWKTDEEAVLRGVDGADYIFDI